MDKIRLRSYDGIAISGFLTLPGLFYTAPGIIAGQNGPAAWLATIVAHALTLCVFLLTSVTVKWFGGRDIVETASIVLGRPVGMLSGVALSFYFCYSTGIFAREGAEIIKTYGLRLTPVHVITGLILLAAVTMNFLGERAVVKSTGFFFTFLILGIVFIALLGLNRYDPNHLFPILGGGTQGLMESGRYTMSLTGGVIALALFAPSFSDTRAMRRSGIIALTVSAVLSVLFYICFIMIFSAPIASKMISGFIEMGKSSYYDHFFYRFESALLFFLIFSSVMVATLGIYIAGRSAALAFKSGSAKIIAAVAAAVAFAAAIIPANLLELMNRHLAFIGRYGVFFLAGFPLILFITGGLKRMFKYEKS